MASRSGSRSSRSASRSPVQRHRASRSRSGSALPPRRRVSPSPSPERAPRSGSPPARRRATPSRSRSASAAREPRRNGGGYDSRSPPPRRSRRSRSPMYSSSRRRPMGGMGAGGNRDDPKPSQCVGVFGLSIYTTKNELTRIFEKFGSLDRVQVVVDAKTGRSRGFAFVYFDNLEDAKTAKNECVGMEIDGRSIRVDFSLTERPHTPTPGIYMGKPTLDRRSDRYSGGGGGYGSSRGGGNMGDRYRSPSPRHRSSRRRSERDYYGARDYDGYERGYDRDRGYERERGYDREYYDRGYDRSYERHTPSAGGYRSRSRSPMRDRYRY